MANKTEISTIEAPQALGPYSQGIVTGELFFISGQIGLIPQTGELIEGGLSSQTHQVLDNIEAICSAAGTRLQHIVKLTIYLTDLSQFDLFNQLMQNRFQAPYPARATVEISALPKNALVEIEAVAAIPAGG